MTQGSPAPSVFPALFKAGLFVFCVYAAWITFWNIALVLTALDWVDGQVGSWNLRPYVEQTSWVWRSTHIGLNLVVLSSAWLAIRRHRYSLYWAGLSLLLDALSWVGFALLNAHSNNQELLPLTIALFGVMLMHSSRVLRHDPEV